MRDQAIEYGTDYRKAQVFLVDADGERKTVYTPDATFHTRAIVLASGAMGRSSAPFKGEGELLGRGVSYCATCDGAFFCEQEVAVVGISPEAIQEAAILTKFASRVHWITPKEPKPDDPHAQLLLTHPKLQHWSRFKVESIEGDAAGVSGIVLKPRVGGVEAQMLAVEGVFIYGSGSKPITDFLEGSHVAMKANGGVLVDDEMATSVPGVYAIGDIINKPNKQAVVAAADGCVAAMSIDKFLHGRKKVRMDWGHE